MDSRTLHSGLSKRASGDNPLVTLSFTVSETAQRGGIAAHFKGDPNEDASSPDTFSVFGFGMFVVSIFMQQK